jgi:hypothetical protein
MAEIYVAGELPERVPIAHRGKTRSVYAKLKKVLSRRGYDTAMPALDKAMDELDAREFYRETARRIESCDFVVTIVGRHSMSPPVEAAIASQCNKLQIILTPPGRRPPRILAGLPFVLGIGTYAEMQAIVAMLPQNGESDDLGTGVPTTPLKPRGTPKSDRRKFRSSARDRV